jgi:branched-chain amino acid aminotransferase
VRLSVSGGNGGIYDGDDKFQYVIESRILDNNIDKLNENGLAIDLFTGAKKSCDVFSNLKSASHLIYVMGARFAKENKLNDCLLLNSYDRICDSTIANLFWIKDGKIFTPALSEGCIAGVMRTYLIERLQGTRYKVQGTRDNVQGTRYKVRERECAIADVENADEIFLTNAIQGIRWVRQFRDKTYTNNITKDIYRECIDLTS